MSDNLSLSFDQEKQLFSLSADSNQSSGMSRPSCCATHATSKWIMTRMCANRSGSYYQIVDEQQPVVLPGTRERITTSVYTGRSGSCYLIVDEQQPVARYEPSVLLRHATRHQRADHDERVRRPQRILVVQDREAETALTFH